MRSRFKTIAFYLMGVALTALSAHPALADKRVALVLGNAHYARIAPLKNPTNDAPDLAGTLKKLGFDVILRTDARKNDFDRALAEFSRRSSGADVALFYYAGHGVQHQGKNYLLPTDIEAQDVADVKFQSVDMASVLSALDESGGVKILILDACRDNPFGPRVATRSLDGAPTRGLARIDRADGTIVVYATAPDQAAMDGGGRNSPFAEALIGRLREPGLEISTMFRRVAADVYERTSRRQRPEVSSSLLSDFFLNPTATDQTAWERAQSESEEPAKRPAVRVAQDKAETERRLVEQVEAEKRETALAVRERAEAGHRLAEQSEAAKRQQRAPRLENEVAPQPARQSSKYSASRARREDEPASWARPAVGAQCATAAPAWGFSTPSACSRKARSGFRKKTCEFI